MKRLHCHLRKEGERALAAYHRVGDNVKGIVVGNQWTEIQTRHVLNSIFGTYARGQFLVSTDLIA